MKRAWLMTAGVVFLGSLTGCQSSGDEELLTQLDQENIELREENHRLRDRLTTTDQQSQLIDAELRALSAENKQLQANANRAPALAASTGFEGIPGVSSRTLSGGEIALDIDGDILFDSGKTKLKSNAKKTLDRVADQLKSRYSGRLVRIGGHTDADAIKKSSWKTNERLGSERALSVEAYLSKRGILLKEMFTASFGPAYPKSSKKKSRRVEIVVLTESTP